MPAADDITLVERAACPRVLQQVSDDLSVINQDERMKTRIAGALRNHRRRGD